MSWLDYWSTERYGLFKVIPRRKNICFTYFLVTSRDSVIYHLQYLLSVCMSIITNFRMTLIFSRLFIKFKQFFTLCKFLIFCWHTTLKLQDYSLMRKWKIFILQLNYLTSINSFPTKIDIVMPTNNHLTQKSNYLYCFNCRYRDGHQLLWLRDRHGTGGRGGAEQASCRTQA